MRRFWIWMNIIYEKCMFALFIVALLVVLYGLYDAWYVYNKASDDSYLKYKPTAEGVPSDSPITEDMVAWLAVEDTNIDYPVMQGENNSVYLNTNPYGEYSLSGSIFLDSRNAPDFTDDYSILYGHHMEYGKMFGSLDAFLDKEYLEKHNRGKLLVGRDEIKEYDLGIFASMQVDAYGDKTLDPMSYEEAMKIIEQDASALNSSVPKGERIVVLSTCAEPLTDKRLLVFCYIYDKAK